MTLFVRRGIRFVQIHFHQSPQMSFLDRGWGAQQAGSPEVQTTRPGHRRPVRFAQIRGEKFNALKKWCGWVAGYAIARWKWCSCHGLYTLHVVCCESTYTPIFNRKFAERQTPDTKNALFSFKLRHRNRKWHAALKATWLDLTWNMSAWMCTASMRKTAFLRFINLKFIFCFWGLYI